MNPFKKSYLIIISGIVFLEVLCTVSIVAQNSNSTQISSTLLAEDGYPNDIDFWSDYPAEELATILTNRMTDEELFAQILMFPLVFLQLNIFCTFFLIKVFLVRRIS